MALSDGGGSGDTTALDVDAIKKDFPILDRPVDDKRLVFLDSAASSQKPRSVVDAMSRYYETTHANVHRGVYSLAEEATAFIEELRASTPVEEDYDDDEEYQEELREERRLAKRARARTEELASRSPNFATALGVFPALGAGHAYAGEKSTARVLFLIYMGAIGLALGQPMYGIPVIICLMIYDASGAGAVVQRNRAKALKDAEGESEVL